MLGLDAMPRGWLDWVGVALTGALLCTLAGAGLYGSSFAFLGSRAYLDANGLVVLGAGVLGAGCVLYLLMEFTRRPDVRLVGAVCIIGGWLSVSAVTKGLPAAVTQVLGEPQTVRFLIQSFEPGGRHCSLNVIATHPDYEDFRSCVTSLDGTPREGGTIEINGIVSGWGIVREGVAVR
jgi:hypothetical protein